MATQRVTGTEAEVLETGTSHLRVTSTVAEVATSNSNHVRTTSTVAEVLTSLTVGGGFTSAMVLVAP